MSATVSPPITLDHEVDGRAQTSTSGIKLLTTRRSNVLFALLVCAALPPITARAMPLWFNDTTALVMSQGAAVVAAAMALNLLMGYAGQISLGHAALVGVGAFTSGLLTSKAGFPVIFARIGGQSMLIGIPAAALMGGAVALLVGVPALRLRGLYLAIVTMGFGYAVSESILRWPAFTRGSAGVELPRRIGGGVMLNRNADYLAFALCVVVLLWLLDANVVRTKLGRAFHGIRESEPVAQSFGIDITRYKLLAFALSGAMAGVAGALYGHANLFTNNEEFRLQSSFGSLGLVIIVVLGGLGSRAAVVTAAAFYSMLPYILSHVFHVESGWAVVIGSGLLMLTIARHPGGFAQMVTQLREQRKRHAQKKEAADIVDEIDEAGHLPKLPVLPRPAEELRRDERVSTVLDVQDLTVRFGGLVAVDRAALTVPQGLIVGLIGPNGAGKSTLFNAVSGFVRPESGSVRFCGEEIRDLPPHERASRGIARTFQNIGLAKNLTVRENFLLAQHASATYGAGALLYTHRTAQVEHGLDARAREAIAALGFERFTDTPLSHLSHGQQRIVELGCVLLSSPELLMLDEPSAGMSPGAAENLAVRLRDLRDELGRTVLLIEHNVPLVLDVCDYIYVLNYGKVLAHGTTEEIAEQPEVIAAYFGEAVA